MDDVFSFFVDDEGTPMPNEPDNPYDEPLLASLPTCAFYVPTFDEVRAGAVPPKDYRFSSVFHYPACVNPALAGTGVTPCMFAEDFTGCSVCRPDIPVMIEATFFSVEPGIVNALAIWRRRVEMGMPKFEVYAHLNLDAATVEQYRTTGMLPTPNEFEAVALVSVPVLEEARTGVTFHLADTPVLEMPVQGPSYYESLMS